MASPLRSMLCMFLAVLGLFAFDAAEAGWKKKCDKYEVHIRVHKWPWWKCVPCGGYDGTKWQIACKKYPCADGWVKKGKYCHKKPCGGKGDMCCKDKDDKYSCKHPYVCNDHHVCEKPKCGGKHEPCCKGHRCKWPYKCWKGKCVKKFVCGWYGQRCCKWKYCKRGLKCWRGRCRKFFKKKVE